MNPNSNACWQHSKEKKESHIREMEIVSHFGIDEMCCVRVRATLQTTNNIPTWLQGSFNRKKRDSQVEIDFLFISFARCLLFTLHIIWLAMPFTLHLTASFGDVQLFIIFGMATHIPKIGNRIIRISHFSSVFFHRLSAHITNSAWMRFFFWLETWSLPFT